MARRSAKWLLLPFALLSATTLGAQQLLFLGYDLRGLLERSHATPVSPPAEGLAYMFDDAGTDVTVRQHEEIKLGYEIADLVLLVTPPTLARHRI